MKRSLRLEPWASGPLLIGLLAASGMARANDITSYSVQKGALYSQTSTGAPQALAANPFVFGAAINGDVFSVTTHELRLPSGANKTFDFNSTYEVLVVTGAAASLNSLNDTFGNGDYAFTVDTDNDGPTTMSLTLGTPVFPAAPHIANFTATQNINADSDFTVSWDPFTGATGNDHYEFDLLDSSGYSLFSNSGTGTSTTIPGGLLSAGDSAMGRLRFVHQTQQDGNSYPGTLGTAGFYSETQFNISAGSSSGGGGAPALLASIPADGATDVATSSSITFAFNTAMANTHAIEWSANVNANSFTYNWVAGQILYCSYAGGLPSGTTITWKLNPTPGSPDNFRDTSGNVLPLTQGSFSTSGSSTVDPCQTNTPPTGAGGFSVFKLVNYVQTNNATPVIDPEAQATFSATFSSPTNFTTSAVSLGSPGGIKSMTNFFGYYFFTDTLATPAALDNAYPAGNYTLTATTSAGNQTAVVPVSASSTITVPQVLNLDEFLTADVTKDFTLRFAPFVGAAANDSISIEISDNSGQVFFLPDPCRGLYLTNIATSVLIPAGTFKTNQNYTGTLQFAHFTGTNGTSIINTHGVSITEASTKFQLTGTGTGGGTLPTPPDWSLPVQNVDGSLDLTLQGEIGRTYIVDRATTLNNWQPFSTNSALNGSVVVHISPTSATGFFRARVQP